MEYFLSFELREFLTENILKWLKNEKMQLIISKIKIQEIVSDLFIKSDSNESKAAADGMKYSELKQLLLTNEYLNLINSEQRQELRLLKSGYLVDKMESFLRIISKYLIMTNELFDVLASEKLASLVQFNLARKNEGSTIAPASQVIFY